MMPTAIVAAACLTIGLQSRKELRLKNPCRRMVHGSPEAGILAHEPVRTHDQQVRVAGGRRFVPVGVGAAPLVPLGQPPEGPCRVVEPDRLGSRSLPRIKSKAPEREDIGRGSEPQDRKSTRLNSSHLVTSYAV